MFSDIVNGTKSSEVLDIKQAFLDNRSVKIPIYLKDLKEARDFKLTCPCFKYQEASCNLCKDKLIDF